MTRRGTGAWLAAVLLLAAVPTARGDTPADHLIGLFVQGCMAFTGNPTALRDWAANHRLAKLPPGGQAAFLQARPGIAFDASDSGGKLVLISGDDGSCDAVADKADPMLARALEQTLTRLGVQFSVLTDGDDPQIKELHYREYEAHRGDVAWHIVVSTGKPGSGAHPMLSASLP